MLQPSTKGWTSSSLLAGQPHGLTRAEIVKAMGRSPGEIYRMLERLVARDYVTRSPQGDRYALSLKLFVLGHSHPPMERMVSQALPVMEGFATAAQQSCHLGVYNRGISRWWPRSTDRATGACRSGWACG